MAGAAAGLYLLAKKHESDPDHVSVENNDQQPSQSSARRFVGVGAVSCGGRMPLEVSKEDLDDIVLFIQNNMYNKILLEIAMGFNDADTSGYDLFKDDLRYFEKLYYSYPDDLGMSEAQEKERDKREYGMLLMAAMAFPAKEVKKILAALEKGRGRSIGDVINPQTFNAGPLPYSLTREEEKYALICQFSALADDIDYDQIMQLYIQNKGNMGWDAMAAICGYLIMRDVNITTPSTNERNIWIYYTAAYLLVGDLSSIYRGTETRETAVAEVRRTLELVFGV